MKLIKALPVWMAIACCSHQAFSQQCDAGEMAALVSMIGSNYRAPGGNLGKVKLYFKMEEGYTASSVISQVQSAMKVRDPGGWMNPYWIVGISDEATCGKEGCVIGRWYNIDLSYFSTWTKYLENELSGIKGLASYKVTAMSN